MRRTRIGRLSRQLLASTSPVRPAATSSRISQVSRPAPTALHCQTRCQSTSITPESIFNEAEVIKPTEESPSVPQAAPPIRPSTLPSPHPDRALRSAKLAALHARLSLSSRVPLQTLARALVDASADDHPRFNNTNLAFVGASLLQYYTSEFLVTKYPRLPMAILFSAMKGFAGDPALYLISQAWGVEAAAAPGEEVDPGYLQYDKQNSSTLLKKWGYVRSEVKELSKYKWRRGMSSRVVYDDAFGDVIEEADSNHAQEEPDSMVTKINSTDRVAFATFVRAVVGAIYLHCGAETARTFIRSYVLSRHLDISNMFNFKLPQRELSWLCARENFDPPLARLISETGRMSISPVFVVGIYSGYDQLGQGAGPSLQHAKVAACINALKAWYLYSPGEVGVPSDTLTENAPRWTPVYVDIGEIVI
ncbi:ribonuclease III [Xylaria nigripes]|nr:ribonuclease III [Xylaria nigripes]